MKFKAILLIALVLLCGCWNTERNETVTLNKTNLTFAYSPNYTYEVIYLENLTEEDIERRNS